MFCFWLISFIFLLLHSFLNVFFSFFVSKVVVNLWLVAYVSHWLFLLLCIFYFFSLSRYLLLFMLLLLWCVLCVTFVVAFCCRLFITAFFSLSTYTFFKHNLHIHIYIIILLLFLVVLNAVPATSILSLSLSIVLVVLLVVVVFNTYVSIFRICVE